MGHRCRSRSPSTSTKTECPVSGLRQSTTTMATAAAAALSSAYDAEPRTRRRCAVRASRKRLRGPQTALLIYALTLLWFNACATSTAEIKQFDETLLIGGYNEIMYDQTPPPPPKVRMIRREAVDEGESVLASLPTPFDSSLGNNFTEASCPAFFQSFLENAAFHNCIPFSLLLQVRPRCPIF